MTNSTDNGDPTKRVRPTQLAPGGPGSSTPSSPHPSPKRSEPTRSRDRGGPVLVFHPLAWLKLQFFCHAGDTEVGGFGVSSPDDPLYVSDFATVRQAATPVTVEFDDDAVADHFDRWADAEVGPGRCGRLWCHTHPGDSPTPSTTDEATFARAFGGCDWAVMFVLSRTGRTYARLSFSAGPGGDLLVPVAVDWAAWPRAASGRAGALTDLADDWAAEFGRNVLPAPLQALADGSEGFDPMSGSDLDVPRRRRSAAGRVPADDRFEDVDWWGLDDLHDRQGLAGMAEDDFLDLVGRGEEAWG